MDYKIIKERARKYSHTYYNNNKNDPKFKQKTRERALIYYYKKKENKDIQKIVSNIVHEMLDNITADFIYSNINIYIDNTNF